MKRLKISPKWAGMVIAFFLALWCKTVAGQQAIPLIKANSRAVTIKDGHALLNDVWSLSPETKIDRYQALRSATEKLITFYTDIDSITFNAEPGHTYAFAVLLKGSDTCYTEIIMDGNSNLSEGSEKLISREGLAMDFMIFRDYMEREHAGLYRYRTKAEMDNLFDEGMKLIREPATKLDFGKLLMHIISEVKDGHTGTNLSSMILNSYRDKVKLFPLQLYFDNKTAFVKCSKLDEFPVGIEILSINGMNMDKIREKLFSYLPGDGQIASKKRHTLNNGSFAFLYHLIFGGYKSFLVTYRENNGRIKTTHIEAAFAKDFDCDMGGSRQEKKDLQLDFLPDNISLLTIKTFDQGRISRAKLDFPKFLEKSFREISARKIDKLIIDLRGNGGGFDEYGILLYSYLTAKSFGSLSAVYKANDPLPITDNYRLGMQKANPNHFKGEIVFLIDGLSFSTTADFCAIAKSNNRGKFVGEETAGAYYGNNAGKTIRIELPHTKIQVVIPKFRYINNVKRTKYKDRGVFPDYEVIPNLSEIMSNKDVQMDYAMSLFQIKKG